uniref:Chlorophyll a-b binding protein, chloroplastic n=2 Tax=Haptolina brevifila TaxID=156173 RepID=A0A7S2J5L7_9EUKA|mmetsp:Transcript_76441/g.151515  ORF Transcript_76441/g.151515 Transcript_76441/m.151515 type:complete len:107 (+) Transcript_76441:313-633(+)
MMVGDGTLAGDMNFDPLQIADNSDKLAWYREAEIKHARLAMLAAFGWPISEVLNFGKLLTSDGRAPSLLNGGLGEVNGVYWAAVVATAVYWESKGLDKQYGKKVRP